MIHIKHALDARKSLPTHSPLLPHRRFQPPHQRQPHAALVTHMKPPVPIINPDFHAFSLRECVEESFSIPSEYAARKDIELAYFIDDNLPSFIVKNRQK
jgi:hypothetical protein